MLRPAQLVFPAIVLLAGCSLFGPTLCTTEARPGIRVVVVDAVTNASITAGVLAAAHDGAFVDSLRGPFDSGAFSGVYERSGMYTVEVVHPHYQPWTLDGVRVRSGECHVNTVNLRAELVATPYDG
ncbi:MAG TPA: hypothetical protein VFG84_10785 [Gemmatimonadaceae bacterium]|nr:hypothetical protein [Gemmatimonadaceae bacterium]